jgi:hypothetical protein
MMGHRFALACFIGMCLGSALAAEENAVSLGGPDTWQNIEIKRSVTELPGVRPLPVLALSTTLPAPPSGTLDLYLDFDEGKASAFKDRENNWALTVNPGVAAAKSGWAIRGDGSAFFSNIIPNPTDGNEDNSQYTNYQVGSGNGPVIVTPHTSALFAENTFLGDFSIDFWMYPRRMENGEQILTWTATRMLGSGANASSFFQRIQCYAQKNRLQWLFSQFFVSPDRTKSRTVTLNSGDALLPNQWSHILVRFNSYSGLLEYLVNGDVVDVQYVTATGKEGGEVYLAQAGARGSFILGGSFNGLLDEFKIWRSFKKNEETDRFPPEGGDFVTAPLDMERSGSIVLRVEAEGGATNGFEGRNAIDRLDHTRTLNNGASSYYGGTEAVFYVRTSNDKWKWNDKWTKIIANKTLDAASRKALTGRYAQVAVKMYPSADSALSPYIASLKLVYQTKEPPMPPLYVAAEGLDSKVALSWKRGPDKDIAGYKVFYGVRSGEYFGASDPLDGQGRGKAPISPFDAGQTDHFTVDGLENGKMYFFAVAAYDTEDNLGALSRETNARPIGDGVALNENN